MNLIKTLLILLSFGFVSVQGLNGASLTDALVGHWDFSRSDGKTVPDLSAQGNDGAITGGVIQPEKDGKSLEFDGMDAVVTIQEKNSFGLKNQFSAAAWIWQSSSSRNSLILGRPHVKPNWTTPAFGLFQAEKRIVFGAFSQKGDKVLVDTGDKLPLKTWLHVAVTCDGTKLVLYLNGVPKGQKSFVGDLAENGLPLYLGQAPARSPLPFEGRIGELRLWKRALADNEIRSLFQSGRDRYALSTVVERIPFRDGTIVVESPGSQPGKDWQPYLTRIFEKLDGYSKPLAAPRLDKFGGWLDRPQEQATGFFRTQKIADRWWLIDPEGYRFLHVAMNRVHPEYKGGEQVFLAKFGTKEKWAEETSRLLFTNGFNGSGSASENTVSRAVSRPLVYTLSMSFISSFAKSKKLTYATAGHTGFANDCIPVFHPDFEAFCDKHAKALTAVASDPYFLGFFSDNELQCSPDLLERHLALDQKNPDLKPGYEAAAAWLIARHGTLATKDITRRDRLEFIAFVFERYYRIVRQATRRYDPHHLYIGSRIFQNSQFDNPFFMKMIGKYVDVISVNYYGVWGPDLDQMARWQFFSGKPALISEWYAKAEDTMLANTHGAGWLVRNQSDRGAFYQHFVMGLLESPSCVGWHWFKYLDDPKESTALDSAGGVNKGMLSVNFDIHTKLMERARAVNLQAYPLTEFFDARKVPKGVDKETNQK